MFGRVASYGVSLLPVSDTKEHSVKQSLFPATVMSEWVSSRGTPAPYGVESSVIVTCHSSYCT